MAEPALAALYRAVKQRLSSGGDAWAGRVFPDLAAEETDRPLVVFAWAAGGEINQLIKPDAEIVLTVQIVADTQAESFTGAGRISELLNDADLSSDNSLNGGTNWDIIHVNQEQAIHMVLLDDGRWIYHDGSKFRFLMESK